MSYEELADYTQSKESSENIVERVIKAREIQTERFKDYKDIHSNAQMPSRMVREVCQLDKAGITLFLVQHYLKRNISGNPPQWQRG